MPERFERYAKLACLGLGALLLYQAAKFATAPDPLASPSLLAAPAPPALAEEKKQGNLPALPPATLEQVEKITKSEILGPVPQPPPMALLGIGGDEIFLRTATGQTGLLRENEELGGIKLIRIGTNRVLIEHEGQLKELTMYSGFGGESLMPESNSKENPK